MTYRISKALEGYIRSLDLDERDRKLLKDCLEAQKKYPTLTRRRWEAIKNLMNKPKKEKKSEEEINKET